MQYYIIDTETTGFKAGWHEMTEISIIRCSDREQLTERIRSEYPERASDKALEVTGQTIESIMEGRDREEVVEFVNAWLAQDGLTPEHRCMIAHRAVFDVKFCHALWGSCQEEFPALFWLDTIPFAKEWALKVGRKPENYKLHSVLKFADINPMPGIHDAGSDARNTYLFWKKGSDSGLIDHLPLIKRHDHKLNQ